MSEAKPPESDGQDVATREKGILRSVVVATVFGVVVAAGMMLWGDVSALGDELARYRWSAFALGLAGATANYLLRYVRWEIYLRAIGIRDVPKLESLRIFVAGFVMSITPGKVGEVFKSLLLAESHGHPVATTAPIVVAERLTDLIALVALVAIGSLALSEGMLLALGAGALVTGIWVACAWRPVGEFGLRMVKKLPAGAKLEPKLREAYDSLQEMVKPGLLLVTSALAFVSWFIECISLYWIAMGFAEVDLTLLESIFAYSVPTLVGALAMLPGGLGATEASMAGALEELGGLARAKATAATLLVRLATLWWAVVLGVIALVWQRRVLRNRAKSAQKNA